MRAQPLVVRGKTKLKHFAADFAADMEKKTTKQLTARLAARVAKRQELLYANASHALLLVFQGVDASAKMAR